MEKEKAAKGQKTKAPKNKTVTKNKKIKVAEKPTVTRVVKEAKEKNTIDASKPAKVVEKPKVVKPLAENNIIAVKSKKCDNETKRQSVLKTKGIGEQNTDHMKSGAKSPNLSVKAINEQKQQQPKQTRNAGKPKKKLTLKDKLKKAKKATK